jgi:hypothetical protein
VVQRAAFVHSNELSMRPSDAIRPMTVSQLLVDSSSAATHLKAAEASINIVHQQGTHDASNLGHICCFSISATDKLPWSASCLTLQLP